MPHKCNGLDPVSKHAEVGKADLFLLSPSPSSLLLTPYMLSQDPDSLKENASQYGTLQPSPALCWHKMLLEEGKGNKFTHFPFIAVASQIVVQFVCKALLTPHRRLLVQN